MLRPQVVFISLFLSLFPTAKVPREIARVGAATRFAEGDADAAQGSAADAGARRTQRRVTSERA